MAQGATAVDNNFEMNGLSVNDMQSSMFYSAGIPVPNPDTIQEFKVQTAQYDATTGRDAGADEVARLSLAVIRAHCNCSAKESENAKRPKG